MPVTSPFGFTFYSSHFCLLAAKTIKTSVNVIIIIIIIIIIITVMVVVVIIAMHK